MRDVLTIILAGGVGQRLHPLTEHRAKPAVPFGGMYRIIDFTLSNCVNSNCRQIQVLVQYKSGSLARHIQNAWNMFHCELGEYINVVPPQMRVNENWYLGTADAIYQNIYDINKLNPKFVMILSGDHIYKMDYRKLLARHIQSKAELSIAAIEVDPQEAHHFGILNADNSGRIHSFHEKPKDSSALSLNADKPLASMGIYVFNKELLCRCVQEDANKDTSHDFGKDIIPRLVQDHRVYAYPFDDENKKAKKYWRDVGTLESYWEANMDLVSVHPEFNLYDREWPLRTNLPMLPPAKFVFADYGRRYGAAVDSIVSPGCIISGGIVERSVLFSEVRVNSYSHVQDSILMNQVEIGRNVKIRRTIIEKNTKVPDNTSIGYDREADAQRYYVNPDGITVVRPDDIHSLPSEIQNKWATLSV